jgi:hypothetical protein
MRDPVDQKGVKESPERSLPKHKTIEKIEIDEGFVESVEEERGHYLRIRGHLVDRQEAQIAFGRRGSAERHSFGSINFEIDHVFIHSWGLNTWLLFGCKSTSTKVR